MTIYSYFDRVSQTGVFKTSPYNNVECAAGVAADGYRLISDAAPVDQSKLPILVAKDENNWFVGSGTWDDATSKLVSLDMWTQVGTLSNNDAVSVQITQTEQSLSDGDLVRHYHTWWQDQSGSATVSISWDFSGGVVLIGHSSAITVTVDDLVMQDAGVFCTRIVNKGPATATIVSDGDADTLNGSTSVSLAAYEQATIYKFADGALIVIK